MYIGHVNILMFIFIYELNINLLLTNVFIYSFFSDNNNNINNKGMTKDLNSQLYYSTIRKKDTNVQRLLPSLRYYQSVTV